MTFIPVYIQMFGPKFLLLLIALILFYRERTLVTGVAVLGIALSAFGTVWAVVIAPILLPQMDANGDMDFVPSGPPPSEWTTWYLAVGGLWLGLLAMLIYVLRRPTKSAI